MDVKLVLLMLLGVFTLTKCQQNVRVPENAQRRVAPSLEVCYRNRQLFERDNRLPMTMNTLIELIRRLESVHGLNMDIRQLTIAIIQRFKQDGILPARVADNQEGVLPFSPSDFTFQKHRVIASRLVRDDNIRLPNGTLTDAEMCALHFMLSTSIETQIRGDEAVRCNQLAQYRSVRIPRFAKDDFEIIRDSKNKLKEMKQKSGNLQEGDETDADYLEEEHQEANEEAENETANNEDEDGNEELPMPIGGRNVDVDLPNNARSRCPVENGVIQTNWGAISAGALITGIAAGLAPQSVSVNELNALRNAEYRMAKQQQDGGNIGAMRIDNRFASTLAGDLAEVVLLQASQSPQIGASGTFNSTMLPRWYFLTQQDRLQMTDAEIRGGLDGLIIAQNIAEWRSRATNLRLSHILSMYYSQRGIFTPEFRACNRTNFFTTVAPIARLRDETTAFAVVLDQETTTSVTLNQQAIQRLSGTASDALSQYITQTLRDPGCASTARNVNDPTIWPVATDLFIYVDTSILHRDIQPIVLRLLENLEFNLRTPGSNYSLHSAMDTRLFVDSTSQPSNIISNWTEARHRDAPTGFNIQNVLANLRNRTMDLMVNERTRSSVGGRSKIALFVLPGSATVNEQQTEMALEQIRIIRETIPDLRILFWTAGTTERFVRFVREGQHARDIIPLTVPASALIINNAVVRIQEEPRRIINHRCGTTWENNNWGSNSMNAYVGPREVVFYRIAPNYFFGGTDNRRVRIQGAGFGAIVVCHSRSIERPRRNMNTNSTTENQQGDITCNNVNSNTVEIELNNLCDGHDHIIHCPPLFISVEGPMDSDGSNLRCTDAECFPNDARFTVHAQNFGCFSGAGTVISSIFLIVFSIFLIL